MEATLAVFVMINAAFKIGKSPLAAKGNKETISFGEVSKPKD